MRCRRTLCTALVARRRAGSTCMMLPCGRSTRGQPVRRRMKTRRYLTTGGYHVGVRGTRARRTSERANAGAARISRGRVHARSPRRSGIFLYTCVSGPIGARGFSIENSPKERAQWKGRETWLLRFGEREPTKRAGRNSGTTSRRNSTTAARRSGRARVRGRTPPRTSRASAARATAARLWARTPRSRARRRRRRGRRGRRCRRYSASAVASRRAARRDRADDSLAICNSRWFSRVGETGVWARVRSSVFWKAT